MGYFLGLSVASSKRISSSTVVSFPSEMFSFNLIKNQQAVSWFSSGNKKKAFLDQLFDIPKKDSSVQTPLWYKLIEQVNLTIPVSGGVCGSSISVELINAYWNIPTDPQGSFCLITLLQPSEILFHTKKQHSLHLTVSNLEGRKKKISGKMYNHIRLHSKLSGLWIKNCFWSSHKITFSPRSDFLSHSNYRIKGYMTKKRQSIHLWSTTWEHTKAVLLNFPLWEAQPWTPDLHWSLHPLPVSGASGNWWTVS